MRASRHAWSLTGTLFRDLVVVQVAVFLAVLWVYATLTNDLSASELGHARAAVILARAAEAGGLSAIEPLPELIDYVQRHEGLRFGVAVEARWLPGSTLMPDFGQANGVLMEDSRFTLATPGGLVEGHATTSDIEGRPVLILTAGNKPDGLDLAYGIWILGTQIAVLLGPILIASLLTTWWRLRTGVRPLANLARQAASVDLDRDHAGLDLTAVPVEMRPLAQAFNHALDRLSATFAARKRFLDNAAHELRTPLAVMAARVDAMPAGEQRTLLKRDIRRLRALSDQLLASARLSSDWAPVPAPMNLGPLLVDLVADYAPLAHEMELTVGFSQSGEPALVDGHPAALTAAFANVLDNALRAEPAGGSVEVRLKDGRRVEIEDHGPGIDPAVVGLVFEPFWRNGDARMGSGLGLAIVAEIVRHHGASIRVEATKGGGATFVIEFPPSDRLMQA
ncbi:HAMP domain-containing histidine kinase [Rubellimicrobium rubrum]|uniref:histidine kinase n=1 Tax=Rubellimicrobium rubrum TaxID=2585369 RepID=A0A5C4MSJ9_9RHOB|nr:HAMP domain-containing sensor histidine kinase [Rubellimicrobium rubrum]TNC47296.1 HAMP domain-containing histidine kinase [Rubellimicrobium rubrum]